MEQVIFFLNWLNVSTLLWNRKEENFILTLCKFLLSVLKSKSGKKKKVNAASIHQF